jgi:hypothetical protein
MKYTLLCIAKKATRGEKWIVNEINDSAADIEDLAET